MLLPARRPGQARGHRCLPRPLKGSARTLNNCAGTMGSARRVPNRGDRASIQRSTLEGACCELCQGTSDARGRDWVAVPAVERRGGTATRRVVRVRSEPRCGGQGRGKRCRNAARSWHPDDCRGDEAVDQLPSVSRRNSIPTGIDEDHRAGRTASRRDRHPIPSRAVAEPGRGSGARRSAPVERNWPPRLTARIVPPLDHLVRSLGAVEVRFPADSRRLVGHFGH